MTEVTQFEPHLREALARVIAHGLAPADAAKVMLLYGVGALVGEMTEDEVKRSILEARDQIYAWMTQMALDAGDKPARTNKQRPRPHLAIVVANGDANR